MLDTFSLRLLGYELDDILKENKNFEKIKAKVTGLSTILEFIIYTIPFYNDGNDSPLSPDVQKLSTLKNLKGESKKSIFHLNRMSKLNNYLGFNFPNVSDNNQTLSIINNISNVTIFIWFSKIFIIISKYSLISVFIGLISSKSIFKFLYN